MKVWGVHTTLPLMQRLVRSNLIREDKLMPIVISESAHVQQYRALSNRRRERAAYRDDRYPGAIVIPLTQNQVTLVDEWEYPKIEALLWYAIYDSGTRTYYAARKVRMSEGSQRRQRTQLLHAAITNWVLVDHKNHDTLDNRWFNMREVTVSQNNANRRLLSNNTSGHVGVYYRAEMGVYQVSIRKNCKLIFEYSHTYEQAVAVRHELQARHFGEFAPHCCDATSIKP
jgi:hypothetical protein